MEKNFQKRKTLSPLNLIYHPMKLAKIETIDPQLDEETLLPKLSCKKDSIHHKIKTFLECSPATLNYLNHNWSSDHVEENGILYCSGNSSNASGNNNNTVPEKKIKYLPDCSPMTQNIIANHGVECFEPQDEVNLFTCSMDSNCITQNLEVTNKTQSFSLSDDRNEELQYFRQENNKENIHFYFDSDIVKASTSPLKLLCSVPSSLSDDNFERETLLLSGFSPLNISQEFRCEDDKIKLNFEKSVSQERIKLELKKTPYLLSNICCEYDDYENKILCMPKTKIHNNKNNLQTMSTDEIQQLISQNIAFLTMNFV